MTDPTASDVLGQYATSAAEAIRDGSHVRFDAAVDVLVDFQAFLWRLFTYADNSGRQRTHSELPELFGPLYTEWMRDFRDLAELAARSLKHDPEFFEVVAGVPGRLLAHLPSGSPVGMARSPLALSLTLFHRVGDWWQQQLAEPSVAPTYATPYRLSGFSGRLYGDALRRYVSAWEGLPFYAKHLFEGWQNQAATDHVRAEKLIRLEEFFSQHLRDTAYTVGAAVHRGDTEGARLTADMLLKWNFDLLLEVRNDYFPSKRLLDGLFPFSVEGWLQILARERAAAWQDRVSGAAWLKAALDNARTDACLIVVLVLLGWHISLPIGSSLALETAKQLLSAKSVEQDAMHLHSLRQDFSSLSQILVRQAVSGSRYYAGSYGSWLDSLVERVDRLNSFDVVPGRIYRPPGAHGLDGLRVFQAVLLLSAVDPSVPVTIPEGIQELATAAPGSDGPEKFERYAGELLKILSEFWQPRWDEAVSEVSAHVLTYEEIAARKSWLRSFLEAATGAVDDVRARRIREAEPLRTVEFARAVESAILAKSDFPLSLVARISLVQEELDAQEVSFSGFKKGQLAEPPIVPPMSNDVGMVADRASGVVADNLLREMQALPGIGIVPLLAEDSFIKEFLPRVALIQARGTIPILAVDRGRSPGWVQDWFRRDPDVVARRDRRLVILRNPESDDVAYSFDLSGARVYRTHVGGGMLLFGQDTLKELAFTKEDDRFVAVVFEPGESDALVGSLAIRWKQRLAVAAETIALFEFPSDEPRNAAS